MMPKPPLRLLWLIVAAQLLGGGAANLALHPSPLIQTEWNYDVSAPAQADFSDLIIDLDDYTPKSDDYVWDDEDYEWGDTQERNDRYAALYGYTYDYPDPSVPIYLHYVHFSRYIAYDGGLAGDDSYIFQLGVSNQGLNEYLAYLWRFGYDVRSDVTENGVRTVVLVNPTAPDWLPQTYTCHLHLAQEDLITIDSLAREKAYEAAEAARPALPQDELGKAVPIGGGATLTLDSLKALHRYAVTDNAQPTDPRAPITLLCNHTKFPIFTRTLEGGQAVSVICSQSDARYNERYILLALTLDCGNRAIALHDLDFMVEVNGSIISPAAVASGLSKQGTLYVLDTLPGEPLTGKRQIWLTLPVDDLLYQKPLRLYVSNASDRLPLWDRPSIGFILSV